MKKIILIASLFALVGCASPSHQYEDGRENNKERFEKKRFECADWEGVGSTSTSLLVIKDKDTGVEYLIVRNGAGGMAITKLEQAKSNLLD